MLSITCKQPHFWHASVSIAVMRDLCNLGIVQQLSYCFVAFKRLQHRLEHMHPL